jgi:transposase
LLWRRSFLRALLGWRSAAGLIIFAAHGHDVRLMSPEYVRPYVKAQKNDDRDAEGIAEAATRRRCGLSN